MPRKLLILLVLGAFAASVPLARAQTADGGVPDAVLVQLASVLESLRQQIEQLSRLVALRILQNSSGSQGNTLLTPTLQPSVPSSDAPTAPPGGTSSPAPASGTTPASTPQGMSSVIVFTRILQEGTDGEDVRALQQFLIERGCLASGNDTGKFRGATRTAVGDLQFSNKAALAQRAPQFATALRGDFTGVWGSISIRVYKEGGFVNSCAPTPGDASQLDKILKSGRTVRSAGDCLQFALGTAQRAACDYLTGSQTGSR